MFDAAIRYPLSGEEGRKALVVGALLTLFSVLLVPAFLLFGYLVRVMRLSMQGAAEVPAYDDWGTLLVDGLKATAIALVYFAIPVVLLVAVVASTLLIAVVEVSDSSGAVATTTSGSGTIGLLIFFGLLAVSLLTLLLAVYVFPAGLARFAATGRMGSAFAFRSLWPVVSSGSYGIAWLLAFAVSLAAGAIAGLVSFLPLLGALVVAVVGYYANVVAFRLYAEGYARATRVTRSPDPPTGHPAA